MSGAAPLSGELMQLVTKILPNACIGQGYGQSTHDVLHTLFILCSGLTETCTTVAMVPPTQRIGAVGSAGQLLPGIVARIVKPDGSLAGEGETGELMVTGPSMALRYFKNEEACACYIFDLAFD